MTAERNFADAETLTPVMREVFATHRRIAAVHRLLNGTKKGVYRVTMDDATSAIVYVWNADEDYWTGCSRMATTTRRTRSPTPLDSTSSRVPLRAGERTGTAGRRGAVR